MMFCLDRQITLVHSFRVKITKYKYKLIAKFPQVRERFSKMMTKYMYIIFIGWAIYWYVFKNAIK